MTQRQHNDRHPDSHLLDALEGNPAWLIERGPDGRWSIWHRSRRAWLAANAPTLRTAIARAAKARQPNARPTSGPFAA
jgi:hypothetical protein